MDRINFNHLFYFYIVAKEGSIKTSAEKLFVSQPTISDQIKLLEKHFGCQLFERKHRSLFLTKEGEIALKYAERIFDISNEMTNRLRNKIDFPKTSLDIGITHSISQYFLYERILPLFNQNEVSINIKKNKRHLLLADLEEGNIDMFFTDNKDSIPKSMNSYRVGVNKTFAVAHRKYRKHKKDFPNCLNLIPFFNYPNGSFIKYEIELSFKNNALAPRVIGEAADLALFQLVTEKGIAFTIVPEVAKKTIMLEQRHHRTWRIRRATNICLGHYKE